MEKIYSFANSSPAYMGRTMTTVRLYDNRVEVEYVVTYTNGTPTVTSHYIWSIKNIERADFIITVDKLEVKFNNSPVFNIPKTADTLPIVEKFMQLLKERL
jgi:hypothetical protein